MATLSKQQPAASVPQHLAIIMDGNGRWAGRQGKERSYGHAAGVGSVQTVLEEAAKLGVKHLTLYTFSTENWNRPEKEVKALMQLLVDSMDIDKLVKNNIRLNVIGNIAKLPTEVSTALHYAMAQTAQCTGLQLIIALSYSSRWEITRAAKILAEKALKGEIDPKDINDKMLEEHLQTGSIPPPDLLIRTGGEKRLSNFLLWQCAYTEFYFCDTFWPDFAQEDLHKAFQEFAARQRRFGLTGAQAEKMNKNNNVQF